MMKLFLIPGFLIITLLVLLVNPVLGQQKSLEELMDERESLYKAQDILENRKTSFWGTQSKKDLKALVENLEDIIRKDNEIIRMVKTETFREKSRIIYKNRDTREENRDLESEVGKYRRLYNQKEEEIRAMEAKLEVYQNRKKSLEFILLGFVVVFGVMILYIRRKKRK